MAYLNGKQIPFVFSTIGVDTYVITYPKTVTAEAKENALAVMKKIYDRLLADSTNFSTVIYVEAEMTYYPAGVYLNNGYMEIISSFTDATSVSLDATCYDILTEDITADSPNVTFSNTSKKLYSKPTGGIPKTDLASAVKTSLEKADTAYQKPTDGIPSSDLDYDTFPVVTLTATLEDGTTKTYTLLGYEATV